MAIRGAIPMEHGFVWPYGSFMVGEVQAMRDFDRSTKDQAVQAVDRDTGELVWTVDVVDADPEARERTMRVKLLAPVQPVPPEAVEGMPFRPVEFDGLTATPYVATTASGRGRPGPRPWPSLPAPRVRSAQRSRSAWLVCALVRSWA